MTCHSAGNITQRRVLPTTGTAGLTYLKETLLPLFPTLYIGTAGSYVQRHPSNKPQDATLHEAVINLHRHRHENLKP